MQNKKLIFMLGVLVLLVSAAAFIAGRMLNGGANPLGMFGPKGDGISILPAEELPKTPPEVEGLFIKRQDNVILVQGSQPNPDERGVEVGSPADVGNGPKVEVVVTNETLLYHDTTQPPSRPPSGDDPRVLQQTIETGSLDDLNNSQSLIMIWGRKSGDRVIADVLVYSNPVYLQKP